MDNEKTLPAPTGKVVPFPQIASFEQAMDYALGGYHAAKANAKRLSGPHQRLWADAADAYRAAYLAMFPLKSLPPQEGMTQAKSLLDEANHKSDVASATAST